MNLPNLLTLLRIFFVPLLVGALIGQGFGVTWMRLVPVSRELFALGIFLTAAATDLIDGYLARRWKQVTTVGTLLDPIADKLLISAALISLVEIRLRSGLDGDSDHRPGIRGDRAAVDRRILRLTPSRQRPGENQDGDAGGRDRAGDRRHPLAATGGVRADSRCGAW